jgi:hypothetical protein
LPTHRSLRAAFQKVYAAVRRTSPASAAARGAQLPSPMALSCTHRSASSRVGRAPAGRGVSAPLAHRPCPLTGPHPRGEAERAVRLKARPTKHGRLGRTRCGGYTRTPWATAAAPLWRWRSLVRMSCALRHTPSGKDARKLRWVCNKGVRPGGVPVARPQLAAGEARMAAACPTSTRALLAHAPGGWLPWRLALT